MIYNKINKINTKFYFKLHEIFGNIILVELDF